MKKISNDYNELLNRVNEHYDLVYNRKKISEEEKNIIKKEVEELRVLVNDEENPQRYIILKRIVISLIGFLMILAGLPSILVLAYLVLESHRLVKQNEEIVKVKTESEEAITKINIILDNIDRMLKSKSDNGDDQVELSTTLEDYAKYIFDIYLKTGEIVSFNNPDFDLAVKDELSILLNHTYGIDLRNDIYTMMLMAKMIIEDEQKTILKRTVE